MGTHCWVGVLDPVTNIVSYIFVHYDGSFKHAGVTLLQHYDTMEKARALVELGSIWALQWTVKECAVRGNLQHEPAEHDSVADFKEKVKRNVEFAYVFTGTHGWVMYLSGNCGSDAWLTQCTF